jgi:hypothetical protein
MLKARVILLALVAVFVASASVSSVAQAQEGPVWHVNGAKLEAGETDGITDGLAAGSTAKLEGEIAQTKINIICKKVQSEGYLVGGNPGADREAIGFHECGIEGIKNCAVAVATTHARSDLGHKPGTSRMYVAFELELGQTNFTTITITNNGTETCLFKVTAPVTVAKGDRFGVLAETETCEEAEAVECLLHFPGTAIKEVEQEGKILPAGLEFNNRPAVFSAQIKVKQRSGLKFGAFQK